ncbi:CsgG/HfaB family protein [Thermospira aquatica]|uniref:Curli production assembly/transport component CsgG n=1 Tax=Thermospira aquatica TaxID=2828656 RepID=A0AAX3BDR9_9SPIR|nr:CsgG/HfaB family protein [Thermospira aquatica]URA10194.1 hypothetical protein KDW03_12055 [Thermospira aquatica]
MKRLIAIVLLGFVSMISLWGETEKVKIAILRIESRLDSSVDMDFLTEQLQMEVVNKQYFLVVERSQLNRILEEQKLRLSGLTEEEQATEIGSFLGAQKIWVGSLANFGEKYMITMKSIDTKTGVIDFADQVYAYDLESLPEIIPDLADRMVKRARGQNVPAYVAKRKLPKKEVVSSSANTSSWRSPQTWDRPDESFDIGFYGLRFTTNDQARAGGMLSLILKDPSDRNGEFFMDLRFYDGGISSNLSATGLMFNVGLNLNLLANGYVLLGGGIGIGFDIPSFTYTMPNQEYSISCFEWTIPFSLQFGIHLGRSFMLVAEAGVIAGLTPSLLESDYPENLPGQMVEDVYIPTELASYVKDGLTYGYAGVRLSFLY